MKAKALVLSRRGKLSDFICWESVGMFLVGVAFIVWFSSNIMVARAADNFTDIFYTNSFRGSFEWFKKLDWLGMVVQAVISIFAIVGVSLIVMRVMTSLLYLSAKGLWEEVHDLKQGGGESEMFDFGLITMAKTWAKGKAGTGLDAIFGAVLILLPDVKKYSDFGEKSGNNFDADTSVSQYILKIALPTVLAVFFLAMAFNGTLLKGLAVTVDAMGTLADKAVSVNYSGFLEDLVNSGSGYKFTFAVAGTDKGELQEEIASDLYGKVISNVRDASPAQFQQIGINIENLIVSEFDGWVDSSTAVTDQLKSSLTAEGGDRYYGYIGFEITPNTSTNQSEGEVGQVSLSALLEGTGLVASQTTDGQNYDQIYHIFLRQDSTFAGVYWNVDDIVTQ